MIVEPFKIKMTEPIRFRTRGERAAVLDGAGHNLFRVPAEQVAIDLLTDSGTGAMSARQWAALITGDESYAGASSAARFVEAVRSLTGFQHVLPVHQGRAAERILCSALVGTGQVTLSNGHFDTTTANVRLAGGDPVDIPCDENDRAEPYPFQGNLDAAELDRRLSAGRQRVAMVIATVTDNAGGGHPVSLENLREVRAICDRHAVPFLLDAARFAENAYLLTVREPQCRGLTPRQVAEAAFRTAHGCWISLKKDAMGNIGGVAALEDPTLAETCTQLLIATEGYVTYGGLAGRDLEALSDGLAEATDPDWLRYRHEVATDIARRLTDAGLPVRQPAGCHAVYIDAGVLLPHLAATELPAVALANELYLAGGVRSAEMGTLTFGRADPAGGPDRVARRELLRLAMPRRVYTQNHLQYVVDIAGEVASGARAIRGYRIVRQPTHLRHFSAVLAPA